MPKPSRPRPENSPAVDALAWIRTPGVTEAEGFAIKALDAGTGTADQQRLALKFIIERLSNADASAFVLDPHGGDRATAYALGRQSTGLALRAIIKLPTEKLRKPV